MRKRQKYDLDDVWADVTSLTNEVSAYVQKEKAQGRKIAVWCAGHFAFTVLSMIDSHNAIDYIIDNAEFKKDRYSPATHIPIKGPEYFIEHPVDTIMILGPMYVEEIVKEIHMKCSADVDVTTVDKTGLHFGIGVKK